MLSSKNNNVYSFRDNSPIIDELFPEDKRQKKQAQDDVVAKVKFAKIFIWSSEGGVKKNCLMPLMELSL